MKLTKQKKLALSLLDWHGGQSSGLYAVGSCMLHDSERGIEYDPGNHRGHSDNEEGIGVVTLAIGELRNLRRNANYPECVTAKMERDASRLSEWLQTFSKAKK